MKKFFIIAMFALLGIGASAQSNYTRQGNNFTQVRNQSSGNRSTATATRHTYTTADGKKYPIMLSANGRAFINRVSRNGNEYKQYLGEEISRQICKEMGVIYKERK